MSRYRSASLFVICVAFGCSGRDVNRDAGEATRSLVHVEVGYTEVAGEPALRFDAQAHFVRYRSFDPAGVPALLGVTNFDAIPLDSCRVSDGATELDDALAAASVEGATPDVALLDAGRLELVGRQERALMVPRHYPDLVPFVAGVVYGAGDGQPVSLALGETYVVSSEGGAEVGPFVASATAPQSFPVLSVPPLRRGSDLDVRWLDGGSSEPLVIELKGSWRAGARAVRCRVRDTGSFTVPREVLSSLLNQPLVSATATAIRFARSSFVAPGAGTGDLVIALRDVSGLQVEP